MAVAEHVAMSEQQRTTSTKRPRKRLDDPVDPLSPAADRLRGYGQIAWFYLGEDTQRNRWEIVRLARRGIIPTGKEGGKVVASKKALAALWERRTNFANAAE